MTLTLRPCFETLQNFSQLDPDSLNEELPIVRHFLEQCPVDAQPIQSYQIVKQYLVRHSVATRYANYRSCIERLLLWSILEVQKPITVLNEADIQDFMSFCTTPPKSWVAAKPYRRFVPSKIRSAVAFNDAWRPFCSNGTVDQKDNTQNYIAGKAALAVQMSVVANFYSDLHLNEIVAKDPARRLHAAGFYVTDRPVHTGSNVFSDEEFSALIMTAAGMADEDPRHEYTLLIIATVYYLRLQPSEIDRLGPTLTMSALQITASGSYDLLEDKVPGNWAWKIHPDYVENHVNRYREKFSRLAIPLSRDETFLLGKFRGEGSICSGHARLLFRDVCRKTIARLTESGCVVTADSGLWRSSLFWVRETAMHHSARAMRVVEILRLARKSDGESTYQRFFAWRTQI
ncbi:hypothetical protein [Pseudomonas fortuita]|uniref:hypothetical protein n=1 Tax=Pseudomonas fortuita TaxID=3233375 RepID=UPI003DA130C7